MIKLTKAMLPRGNRVPHRLSASWVTNGHWAIKRDALSEQATWDLSAWSAFSGAEFCEFQDSDMDDLVKPCDRRWVMLDLALIREDGDDVVLFGSRGGVLGIARKYWTMLGKPLEVWAEDHASVVKVIGMGAKMIGVVMPFDGAIGALDASLKTMREGEASDAQW